MADKPVLLVTRRVPPNVEARASRDFDARLNPEDRLYSTDELLAKAEEADAILCCHTEHFSADVIARLAGPTNPGLFANVWQSVEPDDDDVM